MTPTIALLEHLAAASAEGRDLPTALSECPLPGAAALAAELQAGTPVLTALRRRMPRRLQRAIAALPLAPAESLIYAATLARLQQEGRRRARLALSAPLLALLCAGGLAMLLPSLGFEEVWWPGLGLALPGVGLLLLGLGLAWLPSQRLRGWPLPGNWRAHAEAAERLHLAQLAWRWRLPEAVIGDWFGGELIELELFACAPGAPEQAAALIDYHLQAARRAVTVWVYLLLAAVLFVCGGVVLSLGTEVLLQLSRPLAGPG